MDKDDWDFVKMVVKTAVVIILLIIAVVLIFFVPTSDYSDMQAIVKVQEAGTRYAFLWFGEQQYIRVQNVYSVQYASSSESWETCIRSGDLKFFEDVKNNKSMVNIHVKGNGISTIFRCKTGDLVVDYDVQK